MQNVGKHIRGLRKAKHLTLMQIAKITGIDQATLSRIENGVMVGTVASHQRIAKALGVSVASFYDSLKNTSPAMNQKKITIQVAKLNRLEKIVGDLSKCLMDLVESN